MCVQLYLLQGRQGQTDHARVITKILSTYKTKCQDVNLYTMNQLATLPCGILFLLTSFWDHLIIFSILGYVLLEQTFETSLLGFFFYYFLTNQIFFKMRSLKLVCLEIIATDNNFYTLLTNHMPLKKLLNSAESISSSAR